MADHHLKALRQFEFRALSPHLPAASKKILEVGAGNGWQSQLLKANGHDVVAMDVVDFADADTGVRVVVYDGRHFPFANRSFDIVYTSHVVDHVPDMAEFSAEVHRVLKPGGQWVVVVPTTAWRMWTLLGLYLRFPAAARSKFLRARERAATRAQINPDSPTSARRTSLWQSVAPPIGERGSAFSEIVLFAHQKRLTYFAQAGWTVVRHQALRIYYSGARLLGDRLPLPIRQSLGQLLGDSSRVYFLQKPDASV